jgi:hypothetical protein
MQQSALIQRRVGLPLYLGKLFGWIERGCKIKSLSKKFVSNSLQTLAPSPTDRGCALCYFLRPNLGCKD